MRKLIALFSTSMISCPGVFVENFQVTPPMINDFPLYDPSHSFQFLHLPNVTKKRHPVTLKPLSLVSLNPCTSTKLQSFDVHAPLK